MKLDLAVGQAIYYKGKGGQVIEVGRYDALVLFEDGQYLWLDEDTIEENNPFIPFL